MLVRVTTTGEPAARGEPEILIPLGSHTYRRGTATVVDVDAAEYGALRNLLGTMLGGALQSVEKVTEPPPQRAPVAATADTDPPDAT